MKRLLHKNFWKAGLAVLSLLLMPNSTKADTYISMFDNVAGQNPPYTLQTIDYNNQWETECEAHDASTGVTINAPATATTGIITLRQSNGVYGAVYYFKIDGQEMTGSFSLRAYDYKTKEEIVIVESEEVSNSSSCELNIPEYFYGSEGYQLYLDFTPDSGNSLTISKITVKTSRLSIFSGGEEIYVTDDNAENVLDDNLATVQFLQEDSILILNEANIVNDTEMPLITTTLPRLYVLLRNENTLKSNASFFYFDYPNNQELVFMNEVEEFPNSSLTFSSLDGQPISIENLFFTANRYPLAVKYQNGLALSADNESGDTSFFTISGINPIMDTVSPIVEVDINDEDYDDLDGVVISHVYYTLKKNNDPAKSEGYFDNSDGENGIIIQVGLTDEEVEEAIEYVPGFDSFNEKFRGITMMVPAGIGKMTINAKGNGAGAILKMKLGTMDAVAYDLTTEYADYTLDYQCTEPTYLYIYLLDQEPDPAPARPGGPNHEKVQTISVKLTGYKGNSAAVVSNVGGEETASVYSLSLTGYTDGADNITMSSVAVTPAAAATARPVGGPMQAPATEYYPISSLSADLFNDISTENKEKVLYIDLSDTKIKGLTVDRLAGLFNGFSSQIFLPADNDANSQPNVIVGDECESMTLDESKTFKAPTGKTFKVAQVTLTRTNPFAASKPATVYLPFTIPASKAETLGTFHTFKEISGDDALFNDAETDDIAANTPYIFVPKNSGASLTVDNVTVNTTVLETSGKLIGTYERIDWTTDPDDIYGFSAIAQNGMEQGQFFKVKASSYILPFRAYLKVKGASSRLRLVIGDDTTGITTVNDAESDDNFWYSLDGQRHQGMPAKQGMYIHNNQKVLVK